MIETMIQAVPDPIKAYIDDFAAVRLKDGRPAVRVTLDRVLTDAEAATLCGSRFVGVGGVAHHRYAPELRRSYFYIVRGARA